MVFLEKIEIPLFSSWLTDKEGNYHKFHFERVVVGIICFLLINLWADTCLPIFRGGVGLTIFQKKEYTLTIKGTEEESDYKLGWVDAPYGFNLYYGMTYSIRYLKLNQCSPGIPCPGPISYSGSSGGDLSFLFGVEYWLFNKELSSNNDTSLISFKELIIGGAVLGFIINKYELISPLASPFILFGLDFINHSPKIAINNVLSFIGFGVDLGWCISNIFFITGGIVFHFYFENEIEVKEEKLYLEFPIIQIKGNFKIGFFIFSRKKANNL